MSPPSLALLGGRCGVCSPAAALAAILPAPLPHERIEGRFLRPGGAMAVRWYRAIPALLADLALQGPVAHSFFGVALRSGGGTAAHCTRVAALWADIDAKLWPEEADPLAAAQAAVLAAPVAPSIVVASGGGWQPYWLLVHAIDVQSERARLERLNRALAVAVSGPMRRPDHVHDVARILRMPGSLNHKYDPHRPVTVARYEPARRYRLEEIERAIGDAAPWALRDGASGRRHLPIWDRRSPASPGSCTAQAGRVRPLARRLLDSTGAGGYRSPSEADAAAATSLIGAGLTADEALTLLLASPRGRDALARKGSRHQQDYWRRTVEHAARYVGPVIIRQGIRVRVGPSPAGQNGRGG